MKTSCGITDFDTQKKQSKHVQALCTYMSECRRLHAAPDSLEQITHAFVASWPLHCQCIQQSKLLRQIEGCPATSRCMQGGHALADQQSDLASKQSKLLQTSIA
jgi:hypothetical protein